MGNEIFKADEDYLPLPYLVSDPSLYAKTIQDASFMSSVEAGLFIESGRDKLALFERSRIAKLFIELSEEVGVVGEITQASRISCDETLEQFFGIKQ